MNHKWIIRAWTKLPAGKSVARKNLDKRRLLIGDEG